MVLRRLFRSPTVGSLADWTSLGQLAASLLGGSLLLTWPASSIDAVAQHGWGAAFFLGLAALCGLIFVASVGLIAWRIFRPLAPQRQLGTDPEHDALSVGQAVLSADRLLNLEDTLKRLTSMHIEAISKNGFAHDRLIEKQNALQADLHSVATLLAPEPAPMGLLSALGIPDRPPAKDRFESINRKIDDLRDQANGRSDGISRTIEDLKNKLDGVRGSVVELAEYTKNMFRAQRIAELYDRRLVELNTMADRLDDPLSKGEIFSDWRTWNESFDSYKAKLRHICRLVAPYIHIEEPVFETPNEKFKSQHWQYDFGAMTDDQKHDYKTYRIIRVNFNERREDVATVINAKLYASL